MAESRVSNHKNAMGSRTGDIIVVMDAKHGYLAVNQGDGFNGWHGGPTKAESHVPMMFNMPGPAIVRPAGKTNPAFVHDAFGAWVTANLSADGFLRSWHMPLILTDIFAKARKTTDP